MGALQRDVGLEEHQNTQLVTEESSATILK